MYKERILIERYLKRIKSNIPGNGNIEVFVNPNNPDKLKLNKIIRFTLDNNTKKVYVWNYDEAYHVDVSKGVGIKHSFDDFNLFTGTAELRNRNYIFHSSDALSGFGKMLKSDRKFIIGLLNVDWDWAEKYVKVKDILDKMREKI